MRIGIYGYGNLGKGAERAAIAAKDATLVGIFTRRAESGIASPFGTAVYTAEKADSFKDKIDVMIVCGGSASDLPAMTPALAKRFNVVDSFDNHSRIYEHFLAVDKAAREGEKLALISSGWDPGLFSIARLYFSAFLPSGKSYTFWGPGVSQGHSEALRGIEGVIDARQYTVPNDKIKAQIFTGSEELFSPQKMHKRECYLVAENVADREKIISKITNLEGYFKGYEVAVNFVSQSELTEKHDKMNHGGSVIRVGKTSPDGESSSLELSVKLDSNPDFTASVLLASARAVFRLSKQNRIGAVTLSDVAPIHFSEMSKEEVLINLL